MNEVIVQLKCQYCDRIMKTHESEKEGIYGGVDFRTGKLCCWECCGHHPEWKKDIAEWKKKKGDE